MKDDERRCDALVGNPNYSVATLKRCKRKATLPWSVHDGEPYQVCTFHRNHGIAVERWVGNTDERDETKP